MATDTELTPVLLTHDQLVSLGAAAWLAAHCANFVIEEDGQLQLAHALQLLNLHSQPHGERGLCSLSERLLLAAETSQELAGMDLDTDGVEPERRADEGDHWS